MKYATFTYVKPELLKLTEVESGVFEDKVTFKKPDGSPFPVAFRKNGERYYVAQPIRKGEQRLPDDIGKVIYGNEILATLDAPDVVSVLPEGRFTDQRGQWQVSISMQEEHGLLVANLWIFSNHYRTSRELYERLIKGHFRPLQDDRPRANLKKPCFKGELVLIENTDITDEALITHIEEGIYRWDDLEAEIRFRSSKKIGDRLQVKIKARDQRQIDRFMRDLTSFELEPDEPLEREELTRSQNS